MPTQPAERDQLITRQDLADEWSLSLSTVDRLIRSGQLPVRRIGPRSVRISRRDMAVALARSGSLAGLLTDIVLHPDSGTDSEDSPAT